LACFPLPFSSRVRTWLQRLLLAILVLTVVYLVGANLFLNSPLAVRTFNRKPAKFQIAWSSAWTVWPGLVRVRGLRLRGHVHEVTWFVDAQRANGWVDLAGLVHRTLRIRDLHLDEMRSRVVRGPEQETAEDRREDAEPETPAERNPHPWTLVFRGIRLVHIREFAFNDVHLTGDGHGRGGFRVLVGRSFRLDPSEVGMPAAQIALGDATVAREVRLDATVTLGPYSPHEHPGLVGFDFVSGVLRAQGEVPDLPFLDHTRLVATGHQVPGALVADLRIDHGRLTPGSRFDVTAPAAGPASPFAITAAVTAGPHGPLFHLGLDAKGLAAGRHGNAPPLFQAAALTVDAKTPETRLSRLFETARDLRGPERAAAAANLPLISDVRAAGVRIETPGSRATLRASLDRAAGRIDLAGLLDDRIDVQELVADGIAIRLGFAAKRAAREGTKPSWSVRMAGLHLTGIREIGVGDYLLAGPSRADLAFSYGPDGTFAVQRAAFVLPAGRLDIAGETVARGLSAKVDARLDPKVLGESSGLAVLRLVSGTAALKGGVSSLGFLHPYLVKTPWLGLQGKGTLDADVRLDHGRLSPGSRLKVAAFPIQATIFDSRASGRGTVDVAVARGGAPRTALRVRIDRFVVEDLRQAGWPDYLRGQELRLDAVLPAALDLTSPMPDFDATLDLPDAEVPDLTVYDALLPREGGLWIVSGRGHARLHLEASTATHRARGAVALTSEDARVRFQNLELSGRLTLNAPLASPDLAGRRFDLAGTRLVLDGVSYRNVEAKSETATPGWWARAELSGGSVVWGAPLSLRGEGKVDMQSSGPLLALFAERSRFLRWFDAALQVEDVAAQGVVRLGGGTVEIESLQATGGALEVRSRMTFAKTRRTGDLYLRYGRLAAGIELRDGRRTYKLRQPLDWYESRPQP
jgi:hypothetical protein